MARDRRFVAVHRGGPLDLARHRLLALWAADCAEHVLPLFTRRQADDHRPRLAIEAARAWSRGEITVGQTRAVAVGAHAAARDACEGEACAVARACGHAAATAHMADHSLGAAAYAVNGVKSTPSTQAADSAGDRERGWQLERLPEAVRELVVSALEQGSALGIRGPEPDSGRCSSARGVTGEMYVHGYEVRESERLHDQAGTLVELLHSDTSYPAGSVILEAGCGVGAQTVTLARRSPGARFTSVDIAAESVAEARRRTDAAGLTNVEFLQADIFALPFDPESFDHVFVCFVLEHLSQPVAALAILSGLLRPGGTMTVIEGDHGSTYFHPDSRAAHAAIQCQVELQRLAGGNALIGRQLHPLMVEAGLAAVRVSPRMVYVDSSRPDLVDGFTRKTFTAMIEGVRDSAIEAGVIHPGIFDAGVRDLHRTAEADGVFCYTFFKGVGEKRRRAE